MSEWIKIEDGLPTFKGEPYLVMLKEYNVIELTHQHALLAMFGEFTDSVRDNSFTMYSNWLESDVVIDDDVTHWMPLPTPPNESE